MLLPRCGKNCTYTLVRWVKLSHRARESRTIMLPFRRNTLDVAPLIRINFQGDFCTERPWRIHLASPCDSNFNLSVGWQCSGTTSGMFIEKYTMCQQKSLDTQNHIHPSSLGLYCPYCMRLSSHHVHFRLNLLHADDTLLCMSQCFP